MRGEGTACRAPAKTWHRDILTLNGKTIFSYKNIKSVSRMNGYGGYKFAALPVTLSVLKFLDKKKCNVHIGAAKVSMRFTIFFEG